MKVNNFSDFEYLIVINNSKMEVKDLKTGVIERGFFEGSAVTKKMLIFERLEMYRSKKKIVVIGEPFVFHKELKSGKIEKESLFDPDTEGYVFEKILSFKNNHFSVRFYWKKIFTEFYRKTVFLDFYSLIFLALHNRKNDSKVLVVEQGDDYYQILNENGYSKILRYEIDTIKKMKYSYEAIKEEEVLKIGSVHNQEYIEMVSDILKNMHRKIENDGLIGKTITKYLTIKLGKRILFGVIFLLGIIRIMEIGANPEKRMELKNIGSSIRVILK